MKKILTYIGITFGITWAVWIGLALVGIRVNETPLAQGIVGLTMWFPALGVWITWRIYGKEKVFQASFRPAFRGNGKAYLFSWFFPAVFTIIGAALYYLIFAYQFDPELSQMINAMPVDADMGKLIVIVQILFSVLLAPLINGLFGLGEEIGWRGFLYPSMRERMSEHRAILLCGIIWGLWHAPITIMGHNYGFEYWGYPWMGILAMCVFCTALGILLSWLTTKTGSIWPASIAHGALNGVAGVPVLFLSGSYGKYQTLGPSLPGLLSGIPLFVFALIIFRRHYKSH